MQLQDSGALNLMELAAGGHSMAPKYHDTAISVTTSLRRCHG
jgi:hypothetical protein